MSTKQERLMEQAEEAVFERLEGLGVDTSLVSDAGTIELMVQQGNSVTIHCIAEGNFSDGLLERSIVWLD